MKNEKIKKIGEKVAEEHNITFYYEDFRTGWHQGKAIAKAYSLYSQKYCGCLISEWERFGGRQYNKKDTININK